MEKTIECLVKAFIGESQARNRYTIYAKVAREEGYQLVSAVFLETAEQEKEHASQLFKMLQQFRKITKVDIGEVEVEASGNIMFGTTKENLKSAIQGEDYEHSNMYPTFAKIAESEKFSDVAKRLKAIAIAEKHHAERYRKLLQQLEEGTMFAKKKPVWWFCRECGYMHYGFEPPEKCPSCDHDKGFFQLLVEEY